MGQCVFVDFLFIPLRTFLNVKLDEFFGLTIWCVYPCVCVLHYGVKYTHSFILSVHSQTTQLYFSGIMI